MPQGEKILSAREVVEPRAIGHKACGVHLFFSRNGDSASLSTLPATSEEIPYPTISLNRQNAFAIRICFGDLHSGPNNAAVPTTTTKHIARLDHDYRGCHQQ